MKTLLLIAILALSGCASAQVLPPLEPAANQHPHP